jgi:D-alanyl-lipoteichoic acid acyltransferase DltB (MBOAT superfamily)
VLIVVSYLFYMHFDRRYGYLLAGVSGAAYVGGRLIAADRRPRIALGATVVALLLPLLVFKYGSVLATAPALNGLPFDGLVTAILPIGLSFYTFQAVGYVVDVYVGRIAAERDIIRFAAFMSFFPQLMAGPIERAPHLIPQLSQVGVIDYDRAVAGLRAILCGLFLKIVVADTMAPLVDRVYGNPHAFGALDIALATIYFSFQVYADFAGYSLIAIGSGRVLGVELLPNFAQPYLSQSLAEFWRTWHMTLSGWFRDYVFTPLQFQWRRRGAAGLTCALLVTFTLVGIWHGAGWQYALFGATHGVLVSVGTVTRHTRDRWWRHIGVAGTPLVLFRVLCTFTIVTLTFVLFHAHTVGDAAWMYGTLARGAWVGPTLPIAWPALFISIIVATDLFEKHGGSLERLPATARWIAYHGTAVGIIAAFVVKFMSGVPSVTQFIYFRF